MNSHDDFDLFGCVFSKNYNLKTINETRRRFFKAAIVFAAETANANCANNCPWNKNGQLSSLIWIIRKSTIIL